MPQRVWQAIAVMLALVLLVIGGVTAALFLSRTANKSPRPTASSTPRVTPTPSASSPITPTESGTSPSATPTGASAEASPSEAPSESASGSPSEEPTPLGELTTVTFGVERVGLDDPARPSALSRSVSFVTDGAGDVRASISVTVGGSVRLCLYRGTPGEIRATPLCFDGRKGFVRAVAPGPGRVQWTVVLDALGNGTTPSTNLEVTHRTRQPMIQFTDFRFQGTGDQQRNGLRARITARADAPLSVSGSWSVNDEPATFDYRVRVRDVTAGEEIVDDTGNGESASGGGALKSEHEYQVDLRNPSTDAGSEVRLEATVSWP